MNETGGRAMSQWRLIRVLLCLVFVGAVLAPVGCSTKDVKEKIQEQMAARTLEKATGEKSDVDINGGDVSIKTGDTSVEMKATGTWPADMFSDVPRFSYGRVERVTTAVEGGMKKFNVYLRDVSDDASDKYDEELKAAGWESQMAVMGPDGGMISAQKGKLGLQFMHNKKDNSGVVVAYEAGE
jgi:hypothetical protein